MDNNGNPVKFEEDEILVDKASLVSRRTALAGILMKAGIVKNETQANYVLIGLMVVCLLATLYVVSRFLI